MRTRIVRKIDFCAGHRVLGHENKCANIHGHNYRLMIHAAPQYLNKLDSLGRVIDFSVLKTKLKTWIDDNWDHRTLLHKDDPLIKALKNQKLYIMPYNPTAENMARYLLKKSRQLFSKDAIVITKITLWETPNCYAQVSD